jgi:uncharacterized surface protein with fasciclin (FAS1) repeats
MPALDRRRLFLAGTVLACPFIIGRAAAQSPVPQARPETLADAIARDEQLSRFAELLATGGAMQRLKEPGAYTVFAPNNAAFNWLPATLTQALGTPQSNQGGGDAGLRLNSVMLQHIAALSRGAASFEGRTEEMTTLNGGRVSIDGTKRPIEVRALSVPGVLGAPGANAEGPAKVVAPDTFVSNGVLHVIDTVLLP